MSQENVELIYGAFDALSRHDFDAFVALMDDDVEIIPRTSAIEGESGYSGHEGLGRWWSSLLGVFPDYSAELVEVRDCGDMTFATFQATARVAPLRRITRPTAVGDNLGAWSYRPSCDSSMTLLPY